MINIVVEEKLSVDKKVVNLDIFNFTLPISILTSNYIYYRIILDIIK